MAPSEVRPPVPHGPVPTARQLQWHDHEFYGFIHFGVNTFTDREWGYGDEDPALFNPTDFDADQIAGTAAAAGMSGLILTCKHHDGFCLWPSKHTQHSVRGSAWLQGEGDMVREISDGCARHGIRFGIYLSPWDRNHPEYARPAYVDAYRLQLQELTTQYGELFEVWFDGANGGDGYYGGANEIRQIDRRTYYDWPDTWQIVRDHQPHAVMFSDAGPDVRWVGNEKGIAGDPCWSTISTRSLYPGFGGDWNTGFEPDIVKAWASDGQMLNQGDRHGDSWLPAECDVSIRPGWFYHTAEDDQVRTPDQLLELYYQSVGRGASFLLNVPPDRRGRWHENDVASLLGFRRRLDGIFGQDLAPAAQVYASHTRGEAEQFSPRHLVDGKPDTFWATDDEQISAEVTFQFTAPTTLSVVRLRETLALGQRVEDFAIETQQEEGWRPFGAGTGIGHCRLVHGSVTTTRAVRVRALSGAACPALREIGLFLDPSADANADGTN